MKRFVLVLGAVAGAVYLAAGLLWAGQVEIKTVVTEFPVAILADADNAPPVGVLERNGVSHNVYAPGIGFKVGDKFTVDSTGGSYAVIFLDKKRTSVVKLGAGATIVFLSSGNVDAYNVAITGVYTESSVLSDALAEFDINTASSSNEFLIYTPDAVVGVRGTKFRMSVPNPSSGNPTKVYPVSNTSAPVGWNASAHDLYVKVYDLPAMGWVSVNSTTINSVISLGPKFLNLSAGPPMVSLIVTSFLIKPSAPERLFLLSTDEYKVKLNSSGAVKVNEVYYSPSMVVSSREESKKVPPGGGPFSIAMPSASDMTSYGLSSSKRSCLTSKYSACCSARQCNSKILPFWCKIGCFLKAMEKCD